MTVRQNSLDLLLAEHRFLRLTHSSDVLSDASGAGIPLLQVVTDHCVALIALQGAQLLSFQALNQAPLLWLSPACDFTPGKPLRGGIPVCLPWFGPHPTDDGQPKHGFARTRDWALETAAMSDDGSVTLVFALDSPGHPGFEHPFRARLTMVLNQRIKLDLTIHNIGEKPFETTWALHSYHPVQDLKAARVLGLKGRDYLDNLAQLARKTLTEDLAFNGEVDRAFPGVDEPLMVETGEHRIHIEHANCPSVITWNPGPENAAGMADVGAGNEQGFVCVERGAVHDDAWTLAPGETRQAQLEIWGES
ncbi:D-hexose-6-phosphate mutarotase [Marinimicrobium alkaliphilum]|uniref:D-hexose-6-phosphate mutarotase n=1 Tax=Marinimicrobium alkaliphilum TaxID=2202654 RepID=UPI001E47E075|nr:D-hexose-6-phosphate mutarotase [Marinimicrobium alkaliphilum]